MPRADLGGVSLRYQASGAASGPAIVFVNSLGSDLRIWNQVVPRFEPHFRVLRFDNRGHGLSSVPPAPYSIDDLGGDLVALLDSLAIERAHICGLSIGGMAAMWLGIHAPQRVHRLILANTAARIGTPPMWDERIALVRQSGLSQLADQTLLRWFTEKYRQSQPSEMALCRSMIASTPAEGYIGCCHALREADMTREASAIEAPTLIIAGAHDPATPPAGGRALQAAIRNSRYVELDASHMSAWERPEEFSRAAFNFLNSEERIDG